MFYVKDVRQTFFQQFLPFGGDCDNLLKLQLAQQCMIPCFDGGHGIRGIAKVPSAVEACTGLPSCVLFCCLFILFSYQAALLATHL